MWEEDRSDSFHTADEHPMEQGPPAAAAHNPFSPVQLPHVVQMSDLYQAAFARAVADHQLNKLFNPEYYI